MILQNLKIGPQWVWTLADNVTTVLFTFELLVRVFEKGYLFFVEEDKYWNFFDTLVVFISVGSMVITIRAAEAESVSEHSHKKGDDEEGGNMENDLVDNEDEEDEPVLEGEDEDGFKELESDGEDSDGDFDEEGFGGEDSDGLDEEGFGEDEEDDEQIMGSSTKQLPDKSLSKQGKQKKTKFPRFDPNNLDSILADAEQFSHLIEENDDDAADESPAPKKKRQVIDSDEDSE